MDLREFARLDGLGLAEHVRRRDVTPNELVELALAGVEQTHPQLNAVIETFPGAVTHSSPQGPFGGVPLFLKDLAVASGVRSEWGSRLAAGMVSPQDSHVVQRLRRAGFVILGRTTTPEAAITGTTEAIQYGGPTRNPWDPGRSVGGSSGGSAAAVAAGIVPVAHGTDGGGSIRIPASCCGVVGLKPTRGRVSTAPGGAFPGDWTVELGLTRSVRDSAALLDAVEGAAVGDPFVIPGPDRPFLEALQRPPERLRIAFTTAHFWSGDRVEEPVARAAGDAARLCAEMGHDVQEAAPAIDAETLVDAMFLMWCAATAAWVEQTAAATGRSPGPDTLEGLTLAWYERGRDVRATDFCGVLETLGRIGRDVAAFFEGYDLLLTPTIPALPPRIGVYDPHARVTAEWYYESELGQLESFTSIFNCTGQPAVSLPLYESAEGLPIGVQLAARWGEESTLLRLSAALEERLPWRERTPRIYAGA